MNPNRRGKSLSCKINTGPNKIDEIKDKLLSVLRHLRISVGTFEIRVMQNRRMSQIFSQTSDAEKPIVLRNGTNM